MTYQDSLENDRRKKVDRIREMGLDPYGSVTGWSKPLTTDQARDFYQGVNDDTILEKDRWIYAGRKEQIADCVMRGRITTKNNRGKLKFFFLQDFEGEIQLMFSKQNFFEDAWETVGLIEVYDHVECRGHVSKTQTGELTLIVNDFMFMSKSIAPSPEKFHGINNEEILSRQRYLALIQNQDLRFRLAMRSTIMSVLRDELESHDYLEVETPILSSFPNGANAKPFKTSHNALQQDFYLRIAPEIDLKKLLVGGLERVYEIGKVFRNEGIDATHNPEFTILECYESYADASKMMILCEHLVRECAQEIVKIHKMLPIIDKISFRQITLADLFKSIDVDLLDQDAVINAAKNKNIHTIDYATAVDKILDQVILPSYQGNPLFVTQYPAQLCPLARRKTKSFADRFELYVFTNNGVMELANGYSELNDPIEQLENFKNQAIQQLTEEFDIINKNPDYQIDDYINENLSKKIDHDYINALKVGMPMTGGLGIGVDRLVMVLTNTSSIRDVIAFPLVKQKGN